MVSHSGNVQHPCAPSTTVRPRAAFADILRGVALIGICMVNLPYIALPLLGDEVPVFGTADRVGHAIGVLLFQAKFFPIFSFLFGYGFSVLLARMLAGMMTPGAYRRRLGALFVLGALHALLLFPGDILMIYAVMGWILWSLRHESDASLLRLTVWINLVIGTLIGLIVLVVPSDPIDAGTVWTPAMEVARTAYLGDFASALNQRLDELPAVLIATVLAQAPLVLGAFALGLVAGRRNLLSDPAALLALVRPHFGWLVPLAVIGNALGAVDFLLPDAVAALAMGLTPVAGLALATLYVAGIAALVQASPDFPGLALLHQAGRMSLTNYLGQSLVANALFLGWGLGLYGRFDRLDLILVSFGIAGGLILLSVLWLRRYRIGPLEWLLRCWTDLRLVPLRRSEG